MTDSSEARPVFLLAILTYLKFEHDRAVRLVPGLRSRVWILLHPVGRSYKNNRMQKVRLKL